MKLHEIHNTDYSSHHYSPEHLYSELNMRYKAGVIPWLKDSTGNIVMLFVRSSDPAYGGPDFGIIKGGADEGEEPKQTAIREMEEEVGIKESSIKKLTLISDDVIKGLLAPYKFYVYGAEASSDKFKIDSHEIAEARWMSYGEYLKVGRKSQLSIVRKAFSML